MQRASDATLDRPVKLDVGALYMSEHKILSDAFRRTQVIAIKDQASNIKKVNGGLTQ